MELRAVGQGFTIGIGLAERVLKMNVEEIPIYYPQKSPPMGVAPLGIYRPYREAWPNYIRARPRMTLPTGSPGGNTVHCISNPNFSGQSLPLSPLARRGASL